VTDPVPPLTHAEPRPSLAKELFRFLFSPKRIWLATLLVLLLLLGIVLLLGKSPALAPFIYAVF